MKPLITGIAIIIVMLLMLIFQSDTYNLRLEIENLKYCADEAAASAMLCCDEEEGTIKYNEQEGIKAIEHVIKNYLKTNDNLQPQQTSYWTENIEYTAYFFDDDKKCTVCKNGVKTKEFDFKYPYLYNDEETQYKKTISSPNIIVTINAGKATNRLDIESKNIIRSSGYEHED